ncbi:MAG: helix-turn-helix transcriptional regulator [Lachnospiraceae bacterium]|nr:helix-turn-helix transcriptional regulator [Lachnospiraceae bacterium]
MFVYTNSEQMLTEIKKLLLDEHITQRDLADRLGIKPQGLTKLLNKKNFSFDDAQRILAALGYDLAIDFAKQL